MCIEINFESLSLNELIELYKSISESERCEGIGDQIKRYARDVYSYDLQISNLKLETLYFLEKIGLNWNEDVVYVSTKKGRIDKGDFITWADFWYRDGYGTQVIDDSLRIVGKDWWFEREEYDGSECWCYRTFPACPNSWISVEEIKVDDDIC